MGKLIAVTGATGVQGGAVVRIMLEAGWSVRAITRNAASDSAKALESQNVEVVEANYDDEASLVTAFKGAHAVFAVTNFLDFLFRGKSHDESGQLEKVQSLNLASAAAKTASLEHYIWSTLPPANKASNGKFRVPHFDYKAEADDYIREKLPQLAAKTTYLYLGFYPTNIVYHPTLRPIHLAAIDTYIQTVPVPPSFSVPMAGDMTVSTGIWVRQILAHPEKTKTKYLCVETEVLSFAEMYKIWSEVTGKRFCYVECSVEEYINIWGPIGKELTMQFEYQKHFPDFTGPVKSHYLPNEEIGATCKGFRESLESLKHALL